MQRGRKAGVPGEKPPTVGPIMDRVTYKRGSHPARGGDQTHAPAVVTALATSEQARCLIHCATDRPYSPASSQEQEQNVLSYGNTALEAQDAKHQSMGAPQIA